MTSSNHNRSCLDSCCVVDCGTVTAPENPGGSGCLVQNSSRPNLKLLYVSPPLELEPPPQQLHKAPIIAVLE